MFTTIRSGTNSQKTGFYALVLSVLVLASMTLAGCAGLVESASNTKPGDTSPTPGITSLNPTSGAIGSSVTITGANFGATQSTSTSTVTFNGTLATVTTWSATSLAVKVPTGATTGNVVVTVDGVASTGVSFTVTAPAPSIASLNPTSGVLGASVTITGTNFGATQGASTITFNGIAAAATSWSATSISVKVPAGATTGNVVVTVGGVTSNGVAFTVASPGPSVTSLNPPSGLVGATVTIAGANFGATQGTSTVKFNGTAATPSNWRATSIVVTVPTGATTGNVVVTVGGVASNGVSFTVTVPGPSITSLNPTSGLVGATVTIAGTNFGATQGTSTVKFNGTAATATTWSATNIVTKVPAGATAGNVVVTVGGVASAGVNFTVTVPAPSITSLNPTSGVLGTSVTISGANFGVTQGTSTVNFNGIAATPTSWSAASIVVKVPAGATTGNVVVTAGGVASNGVNFTVTSPGPSITSLNPTSGLVGTTVTITGANFGATQGASTVKFNGTATTPTSWTATSVVALVPTGATTGNVVVTVGGVVSNGVGFTVSAPAPGITSLNPTSGLVGATVTVTGMNFGATQGTSTVKFNGTTATAASWSATSIVVTVPAGATTGNVVVTVGGVASSGVAFTVTLPPPSIISLNPASGFVGSSITITGTNFGATKGTSTVKFNGTTATPTTWSATSIVVPAPAGATTGGVIVTVGGVASNGVTFTVQADTTPPSVPTGLTATAVSSSQINLSWTASTDNVGVSGYNVFRGGTQVGTSATTTYLDSGLSASTTYSYTVAAKDAAGNTSAQSSSASAATTSTSTSCASGIPCGLGWFMVPNTSLSSICPTYSDIQGNSGCAAVETAWGSATVDSTRNRLVIHGGGHVDYDGNEIYAIDFNANPIAPVLVKDASHGSGVDSAVAGCSEAFPDGTPNSRHDYSGFWYLPNQDVYFMYGAGIASCGNFSDGNWIYSPNNGAWTQLAPSTHPNTQQNGSIDLAGYNPTDGCLYFLENNIPNFWKQCYDNFAGPNWTALAKPSSAPCDTTNGSSTIDVSRQLFVCVGGGNLYTIALSNSATVNDSSANGCGAAAGAFSPGIAYDPVQQLIVFWTGGSDVITYNASTHSCATVTFSGGPGAQLSNGTFNRFQYMPGIGAFVLANGMSSNVWTLRLVDPSTAAATDFANRIAASSATASQGFDNASLFVPVTSGNGFYASAATTPPPTFPIGIQDTATYRSGTSSVRFTIPGLSDDEPNGWYAQGYGFNLTAGSTVYFSFAQRMDSNFVNEKVPQKGGGSTYWKQFITSWWDGVNEFNSCGNPDFVFVNDFNEGFPLGYLQCGQDPLQISSSVSPSGIFNEFSRQLITSGTWNGTTQTLTGGSLNASGAGYNCPYSSAQPNPNCFDYPINTWVTYMCEIQMGTFGTASSTITCSVSTPTSPAWRQIIYEPNHIITQDQSNYTLNVLQLLPYWTGRDGTTSAGGTASTWYDEMIISQHPIPFPQTPPAKP